MNAPQPSRRTHRSRQPQRRVSASARRQQRHSSHQEAATEVSAKLAVNLVLAVVAVTALAHLIPYTLFQQSKLKELEAEVSKVDKRVNQLQADLHYHFDPGQAVSIMQEQSVRVDPGQRPVVWLKPLSAAAPSPAPQPVAANDSGQPAQASYPAAAQRELYP